ncbi:hypothetical protein BDZ89DRAFT_1124067 [Hymenopellis radicata]|nr:hypothetical protein BDZ89DRAFT_1124067 [Hymenopellis radicata]
MQKRSLVYLLATLLASYWLVSRWTFLKELRADISFARTLRKPKSEKLTSTTPARSLQNTQRDTSLAFTSVFSDSLRHALNMYDIVSASGDIMVTAYSPRLVVEISHYIMMNGGRGGHPNANVEKFDGSLYYTTWHTDMQTLGSNVRTAQGLFPMQCWRPYFSDINLQWSPSFSTLLHLHHLYSLSANATDFQTRFRIARDFRSTQSRLQALSDMTIEASRACYRPLLEYLEEHILQQSQRITSEARVLLQALDDALADIHDELQILPWSRRYNPFDLDTLAMRRLSRVLRHVRPAVQGFVSDLEIVRDNLHLLARYANWLLSPHESDEPASISNPPDLTRFMTLIEDMEAKVEKLERGSNIHHFITDSDEAPRVDPSRPSLAVMGDLLMLGVWQT